MKRIQSPPQARAKKLGAPSKGVKTRGAGPCKNGCGRLVAGGLDRQGRPFTTCCRGCALGKGHDDTCVPATLDESSPASKMMGRPPKAKAEAMKEIAKSDETIEITIDNIMKGESLQVKEGSSKLVSDLKQSIELLRPDLQASRHNLLLSGAILLDSQTLCASGVLHGSIVVLSPKLQEHARLGHGTRDERKTHLHEGWLQKRGALYGYKWQRVWCILCPGNFFYYADEKCWEKKGEVVFGTSAVLTSFLSDVPPGDASKHAKERPCGFVFDADPGAGVDRRLLYFDAENKETLDTWVRKMRAATSGENELEPSLAKFDETRVSKSVSISDGGLLAKSNQGWVPGWLRNISGNITHGIVFGDAPVQWFMEGAYYEICVKETGTGSSHGLTVGITAALPRSESMPDVACELPRSWTLGYEGQADNNEMMEIQKWNPLKPMRPIKWVPRELKVGDRVGVLVNCKGEVWVLQNGTMIDCAPGKAPLSSPLYAVVALAGNTTAITLVPNAVPPPSALLSQQRCDNIAGTLMSAASHLLKTTGDNIGTAYQKLCAAGFNKDDVQRSLQASTELRNQAATDIQKVARGAIVRTQWFYSGLKTWFGGEASQTPIFQVESESGWIALEALVCLQIEQGLGNGLEFVEYTIADQLYRADLNNMEHVNISIRYGAKKRKIRRAPGDLPLGMPAHWTVAEMPSEGFAIVPIDEKDPAFSVLQKALHTNPAELGKGRDVEETGTHTALDLKRAWRIENHNLWDCFQAGRKLVASEVRRKNVGLGNRAHVRGHVQDATAGLPGGLLREVNEVRLVHGTKPDVAISLLQNGLDERYSDGLFGAGTYFAEDAGKTDQYVTRDSKLVTRGTDEYTKKVTELHSRLYRKGVEHPGNVYYVFLCRAILGRFVRTKWGNEDALDMDSKQRVFANEEQRALATIPGVSPPTHYHSLVGELGGQIKRYREFVHFKSQTQVYPEYLLAYQRR